MYTFPMYTIRLHHTCMLPPPPPPQKRTMRLDPPSWQHTLCALKILYDTLLMIWPTTFQWALGKGSKAIVQISLIRTANRA